MGQKTDTFLPSLPQASLFRSNHGYQFLTYPSRNILSMFSLMYFSLTNNNIYTVLCPFSPLPILEMDAY